MNKSILITGTSKGIGEYLAKYYLEKQHTVIGCSRSTPNFKHQNYYHFNLDVTNEKDVIEMTRQVNNKFGKVDILINNAGIAIMNHIIFTPLQKAKDIFDLNYFGTFLLTREVSKIMVRNKFGRIINFSSVAAPLSLEGEAVYASSKAAIESFTKISAKELASFNITVNAIAPTPVKTDLILSVPKEKIDQLISQQIIKRFGKFEDISNLTDFFIKKESGFVTGQIIYLGGI